MATNFSRYCAGIIEAAWLMAVIIVPVFFNISSSRTFEADKIVLLNSLALLTLTSLGFKLTIDYRSGFKPGKLNAEWLKKRLRAPLVLPVIALVIANLASTLLSINPHLSFWGSYQRQQGLLTFLSSIIILAALLGIIRRREQIERLITCIILASLPVSLYGLLQYIDLDPIAWNYDVSSRVAANLGNPVSLAAYLIMVFPLLVIRIIKYLGFVTRISEINTRKLILVILYTLIALLHLVVVFLSGSRGPLLGWLAGCFLFILLFSLSLRQRAIAITLAVGLLAVITFLGLINLANGPFRGVKSIDGIGRLGSLLDTQSTSWRARTLIWQGTADLFKPHQPIEFPNGAKDPINLLRPLVGYGLDTILVTFPRFYPPELNQVLDDFALPDHAHNNTWDTLVTTGILGLLVNLALTALTFYYGLKWLGLIADNRQRNLFLFLFFGFGILCSVGVSLWLGLSFMGLALGLSIILGSTVFVLLRAIQGAIPTPVSTHERWRSLTLICLLVAITAHLVAINFAGSSIVTQSLFWIYVALLVVTGHTVPGSSSESVILSSDSNDSVTREALSNGTLITVILTSLSYDYLAFQKVNQSFNEILRRFLEFSKPTATSPVIGIWIIFLVTWFSAAVIFNFENRQPTHHDHRFKFIVIMLGISTLASLLYPVWNQGWLNFHTFIVSNHSSRVLDQAYKLEVLWLAFCLYLLLLLLLTGRFLIPRWQRSSIAIPISTILLVSLVTIALGAITYFTHLRNVQANISFKFGEILEKTGTLPEGLTLFRRAEAFVPQEDYYDLSIGNVSIVYAHSMMDFTSKESLFLQARQFLDAAQRLNPLNPDNSANLGRFYYAWAEITDDPTIRLARAKVADAYFMQAVELSPNNPTLWGERATLYLNLLPSLETALTYLDHALKLDPQDDWSHALLGEYYSRLADNSTDSQEKQKALEQATFYYTQAIELNPQGQQRWLVEEAIANLFLEKGDKENAHLHATSALLYAPPGEAERIRKFIAQLEP